MSTDLTRSSRPARRPWRTYAAGALVAVTLLAGCSSSSDLADGASVAGPRADTARSDGDAASETQSDASGASRSDLVARATASMITTGTVGVVVDDPAEAARAVSELVDQSGGRVTAREEVTPADDEDGRAWATLTVRIPADTMTPMLSSLATLGAVENTTMTSTDASAEVTDLAARVEAMQISTSRLETFMSQASSTTELLEAEQTLTERQSELEVLAAQQARLADQIALSTLTINLTTTPQAPAPLVAEEEASTGFWSGLTSGWEALVSTFTVVATVLGVALPWLALAGVGFVIYRWVRRRVRPAAVQPLGADA